MSTLPAVGDFVVEIPESLGFGVCEAIDSGQATVLYTDIPNRESVRRRAAVSDLEPTVLPEEMRVWLPNRFFGWWPARVMGLAPSGDYLVRLAGVDSPVPVPSGSIHVRWDRPLSRPELAVATGMTDSQAFMRARRPVIQNLVDQRSACRGFTAVLSAAVRPYAHQLEVMARVLGDPIMRYVLADEVGLGKTIEAGLIIRQVLLDDPSANVVVVVPRSLQQQWIDELRFKLLLGQDLDRGRVRVVDHDDLGIAAVRPPTMLVIDEAHHVVEAALADSDELNILEAACESATGLLLLTATPIRGNSQTFLALLHLVDPDIYRLENLQAFEERIAMREETASAIELLVPSTPASLLRGVLTDFAKQYVDDDVVQESSSRLVASVDHGEVDDSQLQELAAHLRETYRISRRVVRTRRSAAANNGFPVSGRSLDLRAIDDPARPAVDAFAERWLSVLSDAGDRPTAQAAFTEGVEAVLGGPATLSAYLAHRLSSERDDEFVSATERALMEQTSAHLRTMPSSTRLDVAADLVSEAASRRRGKIVVFSSFEQVALQAAEHLADRFGPNAIARHLRGDPDAQLKSVERFLHDPSCVALVCDESGEEGRNFQAATRMIHLDLPLSINKLEQRIGRVDRFREHTTGPVPSTVFTESASPWVSRHVRLLNEGTGVFDRSVATLIHPLARVETEVRAALFELGPAGLELDLASLRDELDNESDAIDLLEEVESTSAASEFSLGVVSEFEEFEESWGACADAFGALFSDDGGIRLTLQQDVKRPGVFEVSVDPNLRTIPLMPITALHELGPLLRGPRTFNRATARRVPGARLVRIGDPLVDWIESYVSSDERGRAAAVWRVVPGILSTDVVFRFEFKIEFDDSELQRHVTGTRRRLRRRGDAFLAPAVETVWMGAAGELSDHDVERLAAFEASDVTLRGPRWSPVLEAFPDWETRVLDSAERARVVVQGREHLRSRVEAATASAVAESLRRETVLRLRVRRESTDIGARQSERDLEAEVELGRIVVEGLRKPRVTTLTAAALVLAGESLAT